VSSDFKGIDGWLSVEPVANSVVVEFVGLGCEVDTVLGESVVNFGELAPVSGLPLPGEVLVRNDSDVYLFNGVFELVHQHVGISLVNGLLLISMDADE
jgi:hypothetical protein